MCNPEFYSEPRRAAFEEVDHDDTSVADSYAESVCAGACVRQHLADCVYLVPLATVEADGDRIAEPERGGNGAGVDEAGVADGEHLKTKKVDNARLGGNFGADG